MTVTIHDPATDENSEAGVFKALKAERLLHKTTKRQLTALEADLGERVNRLEARGLTPVLDALASMRRDSAAAEARLRSEVKAELAELAERVEQLASMLRAG